MEDEIGQENFVKEKVDRETALKEFDRFVEIWDIDDEQAAMSTDDRSTFEAHKNRIVKEICVGNASVDEGGDVSYKLKHPRNGSSITELVFKVSRANKSVMDQYKGQQEIHKIAAYVGSLAGQAPKIIMTLDPRDQKFGEALAVLFLAS